ncbi:T9SS type B sorting domain-containing protein [Tenacibaculum discolor]|uniref:T9SS type B sorting domain-containing protein n=1 Tax=Tenacibaculum discolor TaxID=361581 RepID=UPI003F7AFCD2
MKNISLILLLFCFTISTFAQKETNIWYFGENAGLDFNSGAPVALNDGILDTHEGCATISDKDGMLLFYTDGITVYNKNHTVMMNGTGLLGNISSSHSAIIIPKPSDSNIYYIFTVDELGGSNGLQYSEVDMSLDGGLGSVINKNILLKTPTSEKLTAVKSTDGYWVLSHLWNSNEFIAYKVSTNGVNTVPVISPVGSQVGPDSNDAIGTIKISPNGKKIAVARTLKNVQLFDFDTATGQVSNEITLLQDTNDYYYGVEFSPNNNVLYVSYETNKGIHQFDLNAGSSHDIINSRLKISGSSISVENYGALQLASDGKIYAVRTFRDHIDVINNPNMLGLGCNYQEGAVSLNGRLGKLGLPPFIQSFFRIDDIIFEDVCFNDTTKFSLVDSVDSVIWDFGDPSSGINNTSVSLNPTHVFSSPGDYEVSITATVGSQTINKTATVTIYKQPIAYPIVDQISFDDGNGLHDFDTSLIENTILNGQTGMEVQYYDSSGIELSSPLPNPLISGTETITAKIINPANINCYDTTDIKFIVNNSNPDIDIDFPKFFTPNGDGFNDTWQVNGQLQLIKDIFIFNRYGKLLKQLNPTSTGWDGTYNGKIQTSNDYWFTVSLEDGRIFKGHFSLIR